MVDEKKIDAVKNAKSPLSAADAIVIAVLVVLTALLLWAAFGKSGEKVIVSYDGKTEEYELNRNREIVIKDKLTVCIENGTVYVKDSHCPDKICEKSGAVKRAGQTIICAPQGVTIRITDRSGGNRVTTG